MTRVRDAVRSTTATATATASSHLARKVQGCEGGFKKESGRVELVDRVTLADGGSLI